MSKPPCPPLLGGNTNSREDVMRPKVSISRRARPSCWREKTVDLTPQATDAAAAAAPRRRRRRPSDLLWASTVAALAFLSGGGDVRLVSAVCPNRCSGHGECGLENVCECEADWDIVADCSLKQCPTGVSWGSKVWYSSGTSRSIQGASLPGVASAASYVRSQGRIEQNANQADRDVHDFRCKLTTCNAKSSMLQQNNPDAGCMHEIHRKNRIETGKQREIFRASHKLQLLCEWLYIYVSRADLNFFILFENTVSCTNARRHAGSHLSPTLSDYLHCRALIGT